MNLKRIQTPYSLLRDFGADKTNSIVKICPKFQVLGFDFSEVDKLQKIVQSENISTPIHVQCDELYW